MTLDQPDGAVVAGASIDSHASYVAVFAHESVTLEKAVTLQAMGGGLVWVTADSISAGLLGRAPPAMQGGAGRGRAGQ